MPSHHRCERGSARRFGRYAAVGGLVLALACTDREPATAPAAEHTPRASLMDELGQRPLVAEVEDDAARWATVSVTGPGLKEPLEFKLERHEDGLYGPIALPPGEGRQIVIRAYDADGRETHAGMTALAVGKELTPQASLLLEPAREPGFYEKLAAASQEAIAAGEAPPDVDVGDPLRAYVGSYRLTMTPRAFTGKEGEPVEIQGRVFDPGGTPVPIGDGDLSWILPDDGGKLGDFHGDVRDGVAFGELLGWVPPEETKEIILCYIAPESPEKAHYCRGTTLGPAGPRPPATDPIVAVDGGSDQTCARRLSGWVRCWGHGSHIPTSVLDSYRFASISVGGAVGDVDRKSSACGFVRAVSEVACWGDNTYAQLGGPSAAPHPTTVSGGFSRLTSVTTGASRSCGIEPPGNVWCWGEEWGKVGLPWSYYPLPGLAPTRVSGGWVQLSAGDHHICGIDQAGDAYCFGSTTGNFPGSPGWTACGQSGGAFSSLYCAPQPLLVPGGIKFSQISAGGFGRTCGLDRSGLAYCWGPFHGNSVESAPIVNDQLNSSLFSRGNPVPVDGGRQYTRIAVGYQHTCALTAAGEVFCWGSNRDGAVGDGARYQNRYSPVPVATMTRYQAIGVGARHSCAVVVGGSRVDCWGSNDFNQLNRGTITWMSPSFDVPAPALW